MNKKAGRRGGREFDLKKHRLTFCEYLCGLVSFAAILFIVGLPVVWNVWDGKWDKEVVHYWARILFIVLSALTLGGFLFPIWRTRSKHVLERRIETLCALPSVVKKLPSVREEIDGIRLVLESNEKVNEKVMVWNYFIAAFAIIASGVMIGCELYS